MIKLSIISTPLCHKLVSFSVFLPSRISKSNKWHITGYWIMEIWWSSTMCSYIFYGSLLSDVIYATFCLLITEMPILKILSFFQSGIWSLLFIAWTFLENHGSNCVISYWLVHFHLPGCRHCWLFGLCWYIIYW